MIKRELESFNTCYTELEKRLQHQEKIMKELIGVKLQEITNDFKKNNDKRFDEIQDNLLKNLNINIAQPAPITQSQSTGPANGGVMVEKSPSRGGGP